MKFFAVGGLGFFVDMGVTWICKEKMKMSKYVSNSIGFIMGNIFRFHLNKVWAFQDYSPEWQWQLLKFMVIAVVGLALVNGIIYFINERKRWFSFYNAKILALIVFMFFNFSANYYWTFVH
jgi:putative flippase GtrA